MNIKKKTQKKLAYKKKRSIKVRTRKVRVRNVRPKKVRSRKGGNNEICCMCEKSVNSEQTLIPNECLAKYGKARAHKICQDCWWNKFAKEGVSHKCPGCVKNMPLNAAPANMTFIDLTEDD
jgi:hypothetical protein